jgi:hypothetical protein
VWAVFGSAVHSLLESEGANDFTEQEMSYKVGDITITGRIDNYDMQNGIICNYKTASVYKVKFGDFNDWYLQGMIYAWLLARNNFPVKKCRFVAMLKDHSKTDAMRDKQYPQNPVYVYEFPVTAENLFKIGAFIRMKVDAYKHNAVLTDNDIPPCLPVERWERPAKYAVKKEGRKTAVRLFDDENAANELVSELGKGHCIEHRKGESIKCQSFCLCSRFCNYFHENVKTNSGEISNVEITNDKSAEKVAA